MKTITQKIYTILIADDSPTMRLMMEELLKNEGYQVLTAEDGIQAASVAFEHNPNLIISDIEMPKMNGYQVCRLLKNDPATCSIPIIILTSKDSSGSVFWSYQTGVDLYVLKDFKSKELLVSIKNLLNKSDNKEIPEELKHQKVDSFQIMEKLNRFLDDRLFEMTLVNEINRITINLLTLPEALAALLNILDKSIDNHVIGFAVFGEEKHIQLSLKLSKPLSVKLLDVFQYQVLEELSITVNKDISEYEIDAEIQDERMLRDDPLETGKMDFDPNLIYSIPVRIKEETLGLLNIYHPQMLKVSYYQKSLLEKLAPHISTSIGTISMHNRIKELSVIDGLTQLYNRRYIMELFKTEFNKANRYKQSFALMMIDIDDFKKINDTHGHLSGDLVLKTLSGIIKKRLRNVDLPGRYGGEEFVLLLPETNKESAVIVAERIREEVQNHKFKTMNNELLTVTISLGLSEFDDLENKSNELEMIKLADSRLYNAKRSGKNRVIST
ncbi:MAG: diguanylate cyclase [bacterium]|nr:diguanylate cyclase [bacterium]